MQIKNTSSNKKWLMGVDDSISPIEIGFITNPNDILHYHNNVYEYYILVSGELKLLVNNKEIILKEGDVCCVEPKERHRIISSSKNFKCYLLKYPHLPEDKILC
ncbi:MAG: cupin domain-containing protein [Candidatus Nanoarchaeia archaeon]